MTYSKNFYSTAIYINGRTNEKKGLSEERTALKNFIRLF